MPPFLGGGDMISSVTYEKSTWARVPHKFEAGTPAILEGIGLGAAIDYVRRSAMTKSPRTRLADRTRAGTSVALEAWDLGQAQDRGGVVRSHWKGACARCGDVARPPGIAVRAGHHCAEPLMHRFGLDSTARASFGIYTTHERNRRAGRRR